MKPSVLCAGLLASQALVLLAVPSASIPERGSYFVPRHVLPGLGVSRQDMSDETIALRTEMMIESQTFTIMREPQAVPGAERITRSRLQSIFRDAERRSGMPASLLEAIGYLESWGVPDAESPAGPRGIMQIAEATAKRIGLRIVRSTRYRTTKERVAVRRKGKTTYRTVRKRVPYTVTVRDERLQPEKAIPAAATYLAQMEQRFGGRDWAIFAYHCGEGCAADMQALTRAARGTQGKAITVPRMFFTGSPASDRELYEAVSRQMERDYSPTYYFRVMRAQQLLALYRTDPKAFRALAEDYKSQFSTAVRAPNRLSVWLKKQDLLYRSGEDIESAEGVLVKAFDDPAFFGYKLDKGARASFTAAGSNVEDDRPRAAPSTIGTLAYIVFETRRLYEELAADRAPFEPIEVTALVKPLGQANPSLVSNTPQSLAHSSGQVFDIRYSHLPRSERECLRFILDDLGWYGYLGFVEEAPGSEDLHIGPSPSARAFFSQVYDDAQTQ